MTRVARFFPIALAAAFALWAVFFWLAPFVADDCGGGGCTDFGYTPTNMWPQALGLSVIAIPLGGIALWLRAKNRGP